MNSATPRTPDQFLHGAQHVRSTSRPLPPDIREFADKTIELPKLDSKRPSLRLKKTGNRWPAHVGLSYRALGP